MDWSRPDRSRWRPLLAAVATLLVLVGTGAPLWGPMASFAQGLPVITLCACWLASATGQGAPRLTALAAAALLIAPAVGYRITRVSIDTFEAGYLMPESALPTVLMVAANSPRGTGPLLLAAGIASAVGMGRAAGPVTGACLGGALGASAGRLLLEQAGNAWLTQEYANTARLAQLSAWTGVASLAGGLLGLAWSSYGQQATLPPSLRRVPALLSLLVMLACGWASSPPLQMLTRSLPVAVDDHRVQNMPPGRAFAAPVLSAAQLGDPPAMARQLEAWRLQRQRPDAWPCTPLPPIDWAEMPRNAVIAALPPELPVRDLGPVVRELIDHGVYDLVLPGRAPPLPGEFGAIARWSGTSLLLDRPVAGVQWVAADAHGWQVIEPASWFAEGHAVCALLADPSMSIGQLTYVGRQLSEPGGDAPCQDALALVPFWPEAQARALPVATGCAALPAPIEPSDPG